MTHLFNIRRCHLNFRGFFGAVFFFKYIFLKVQIFMGLDLCRRPIVLSLLFFLNIILCIFFVNSNGGGRMIVPVIGHRRLFVISSRISIIWVLLQVVVLQHYWSSQLRWIDAD